MVVVSMALSTAWLVAGTDFEQRHKTGCLAKCINGFK